MSLFVCSKCHTIDNTALCNFAVFMTEGKPVLCSICDPKIGKWHRRFTADRLEESDYQLCPEYTNDPNESVRNQRIVCPRPDGWDYCRHPQISAPRNDPPTFGNLRGLASGVGKGEASEDTIGRIRGEWDTKESLFSDRERELLSQLRDYWMRHAEACDHIRNRTMAERQKVVDLERVALLEKILKL